MKYVNIVVKKIKKEYKKKYSAYKLLNNNYRAININYIIGNINSEQIAKGINIYGVDIEINDKINWHKDYIANYEFPRKRFDKYKTSKWYDKGIDIKFPWELSRFHFGVDMAQNYVATKDEKYYKEFKRLVIDWIENNPFLYGVNWLCSMDVAIRAANWITAINILKNKINTDDEFKELITKSLIQHAYFISSFPSGSYDGHTNNHAVCENAGLLFLALTLREHKKSKEWLKQAMEGLLNCMDYQVYEDGGHFESSIPYHRLVLETFAYSTIVARDNDIDFPKWYYQKLFKMFEYTAAYIDHNCYAPQVGDNDSGRFLKVVETDEHDHSYLLDLGEVIFSHEFKSWCNKRSNLKDMFHLDTRISIVDLNIHPRQTDKSTHFKDSGAYILKSESFSVLVSLFPVGSYGRGGHTHDDYGSITISYNGHPIVVDPGSYVYTRDRSIRNQFRSKLYHNVIIANNDSYDNTKNTDFSMNREAISRINMYNTSSIDYSFNNLHNRKISINDDIIMIMDISSGVFASHIHFHPKVIIKQKTNNLYLYYDNKLMGFIEIMGKYELTNYEYSYSYNCLMKAKKLIIMGEKKINYSFNMQ